MSKKRTTKRASKPKPSGDEPIIPAGHIAAREGWTAEVIASALGLPTHYETTAGGELRPCYALAAVEAVEASGKLPELCKQAQANAANLRTMFASRDVPTEAEIAGLADAMRGLADRVERGATPMQDGERADSLAATALTLMSRITIWTMPVAKGQTTGGSFPRAMLTSAERDTANMLEKAYKALAGRRPADYTPEGAALLRDVAAKLSPAKPDAAANREPADVEPESAVVQPVEPHDGRDRSMPMTLIEIAGKVGYRNSAPRFNGLKRHLRGMGADLIDTDQRSRFVVILDGLPDHFRRNFE